MGLKQIRIVLTCVGSPLAYEMIRAFSKSDTLDIRVIGTDKNPEALGKHFSERFYCVPSGKEPDYPDALKEICDKEDIHVVIPGSDEEAFSLANHVEQFDNMGVVCTVPRKELIDCMSNKFNMYETLRKLGIEAPSYYLIDSPDDLEAASRNLGYPNTPFILKPASGRGSRGIWRVNSKAERGGSLFGRSGQVRDIRLEEMAESLGRTNYSPSLVAMEHMEGDFYDIDILSKEGESVYKVVRRRVNPFGVPFRGSVLEDNMEILTLAEKLQNALRLTYLYDFDIVYHPDRGAHIMEVNPRPSGGIVATIEAGVNLFEYLVRMAVGLDVPQVDVPYGTTILPKTTVFKI